MFYFRLTEKTGGFGTEIPPSFLERVQILFNPIIICTGFYERCFTTKTTRKINVHCLRSRIRFNPTRTEVLPDLGPPDLGPTGVPGLLAVDY